MTKFDELPTVKITVTQDDIDTIKENADDKINELSRKARELERESRKIRKEIKEYKPYSESPMYMAAILAYYEREENDGKTEKEIQADLRKIKIEIDVIEE